LRSARESNNFSNKIERRHTHLVSYSKNAIELRCNNQETPSGRTSEESPDSKRSRERSRIRELIFELWNLDLILSSFLLYCKLLWLLLGMGMLVSALKRAKEEKNPSH